VAWKGNTQILLWFGPRGLSAYQVTWTYPLTHFDSRLKTDLCSGIRYVNLMLIGDSELAGAAVWLDDERVGELSEAGNFNRDVPVGVHHLRVEKPDGGSWRTELRYDEANSGHDRLVVPGDTLAPR
jgi:hypothetical protein